MVRTLSDNPNAIILAHNYHTPEIVHGVADLAGDSLALARQAALTDAEVIVLCGVHFMAETAKLLCPEKTVVIPDLEAGCSLASSITADDVRVRRRRYPGVSVDIPARRVSGSSHRRTNKRRRDSLDGALRSPRTLFGRRPGLYREQYRDIQVLAHPECPPDVLAEADFVGSTSGMIRYVAQRRPTTEFIRPCNLCPHMKRITLPKILRSLETLLYPVVIEPAVAEHARRAVERMLHVAERPAQ